MARKQGFPDCPKLPCVMLWRPSVLQQIEDDNHNRKDIRNVIKHHPVHPSEFHQDTRDITYLANHPQSDKYGTDPFCALVSVAIPGLRDTAYGKGHGTYPPDKISQ
jgi:hypothetical protein